MAVFAKELCEKRLQLWLDAEEAIATGQSYRIGNRELERADLNEVRNQIEYWSKKLNEALNSGKGRNRIYRAVMKDD